MDASDRLRTIMVANNDQMMAGVMDDEFTEVMDHALGNMAEAFNALRALFPPQVAFGMLMEAIFQLRERAGDEAA